MAHRTFTDARGRSWEVWEVRPGLAVIGDATDRRRGGDRRGAADTSPPATAAPDDGHGERRRLRHERRMTVSARLRGGWLAFRAGDDRRRLAPVPRGWEADSDLQLAAYCRAATPVGTVEREGAADHARPLGVQDPG